MKRFKCTVERTDKYIIEFDEKQLNEEWINQFKESFYDFDTLEEHAEHIAQHRARFGVDFIEGYGSPLVNGKSPYYDDKKEVERAINIKIVSENNNCDVDVVEI